MPVSRLARVVVFRNDLVSRAVHGGCLHGRPLLADPIEVVVHPVHGQTSDHGLRRQHDLVLLLRVAYGETESVEDNF